MTEVTTVPDLELARAFFDACETGKGWEVCQQFCTPDATFSAQAEALENVHTLEQYCDWMKGLLTILPDGHYELKSFAADAERNNVIALRRVLRHSHRRRRSGRADREKRECGLRVRDGLPGRPDWSHDEDLAFRHHAEATGVGMKAARQCELRASGS